MHKMVLTLMAAAALLAPAAGKPQVLLDTTYGYYAAPAAYAYSAPLAYTYPYAYSAYAYPYAYY